MQKFLKSGGQLQLQKVWQVAELIIEQNGPVDLDGIKQKTGLSERKLAKTINRLEDSGAVETLESGEVAATGDGGDIELAARQLSRSSVKGGSSSSSAWRKCAITRRSTAAVANTSCAILAKTTRRSVAGTATFAIRSRWRD